MVGIDLEELLRLAAQGQPEIAEAILGWATPPAEATEALVRTPPKPVVGLARPVLENFLEVEDDFYAEYDDTEQAAGLTAVADTFYVEKDYSKEFHDYFAYEQEYVPLRATVVTTPPLVSRDITIDHRHIDLAVLAFLNKSETFKRYWREVGNLITINAHDWSDASCRGVNGRCIEATIRLELSPDPAETASSLMHEVAHVKFHQNPNPLAMGSREYVRAKLAGEGAAIFAQETLRMQYHDKTRTYLPIFYDDRKTRALDDLYDRYIANKISLQEAARTAGDFYRDATPGGHPRMTYEKLFYKEWDDARAENRYDPYSGWD